ncbi:MAG: signal peptidase I [Actinobacteria bacterium]|nr:MAG: signal peptidase I [Actinomycetota bacterium]
MSAPPARGEPRSRAKGAALVFTGVLGALVAVVVLLVIVALVTGVVRAFRQPSESMAPTIKRNQHLITTGLGFPFSSTVHRGDIVVLHPSVGLDRPEQACAISREPADGHPCARALTQQSSSKVIKRVVAVGGDRIRVVAGRVYIDGVASKEPYARTAAGCLGCELPREITVPPGQVFVMGDNRPSSDDSRFWGPVPMGWVIGRKLLVY